MIECTNLSKEYQTRVVNGVSLSIADGEYVAVMGPSGSGKSTLLNLLAGLDAPTSGSVHINGVNLADLAEPELAAIRLHAMGIVFQQPNFVRALTLLDNIVFPGFMAKTSPREVVVAKARSLMEELGISDIADKGVTEVSGGQLQRASICRALINDPTMIFGDEPTGALNSTAAQQVLEAFADIHARGTTVMVVTHDPQVAVRASRVIIIADGQVRDDLSLGPYHPVGTGADRLASDHHDRLSAVTLALRTHGV